MVVPAQRRRLRPTAGSVQEHRPQTAGAERSGRPSGASPAAAVLPIGQIVLVVLVLVAATPGSVRLITRRRRWRSASGRLGPGRSGLAGALRRSGRLWLAWPAERVAARPGQAGRARSQTSMSQAGRPSAGSPRSSSEPGTRRCRHAAGAIRADVTIVRRALARSATRWSPLAREIAAGLDAAARAGLGPADCRHCSPAGLQPRARAAATPAPSRRRLPLELASRAVRAGTGRLSRPGPPGACASARQGARRGRPGFLPPDLSLRPARRSLSWILPAAMPFIRR